MDNRSFKISRKTKIAVIIILLILLIVILFSCIDDKEEADKGKTDKVTEAVQQEDEQKGNEENEEAVVEDEKVAATEEVKGEYKGETSKKEETVTKPSGNSGNTVNKPSTETKPSGNTTVTKPEPQKPVHTHSWEPVYEEVVGGYYETVIEEVPYTKCNYCGANISGDVDNHIKNHALSDGVLASYGTDYEYHEVETWIPCVENVIAGYECSCGATK